jgi:UDP-N-acetylmuramate--alanine ligase
MTLDAINRVYFVGIGGIGMSALARYFAKRGTLVCGYDKTRTNLTIELEREGITITYLDEPLGLPISFHQHHDDTLVIYTPAIPKDAAILRHFKDEGFVLKKRAEVLGIISRGQICIAVAGTHGKTTTSSIIAHILTATGYGCTAFLGGIATNYNSNFLIGDNNVVVIEADEYDRSFLTLNPDVAVITSMDADHLDIYGDTAQLHESFQLFASQLKLDGTLFVKEGLPIENATNYGLNEQTKVNGHHIRVVDSTFVFDYHSPAVQINDLSLMLPGKHNVENTVAAIAVALELGIDPEDVKAALATYKGVKRRFEYILKTGSHIYIDDYAHHPEELKACFAAVRQLYPDKKLTVLFQPHLYTRTRDFAAEFATVLSSADELLLLDIYPARELPIPGINASWLLNKITLENKTLVIKDNVLELLNSNKPELLLTVGAGDIDTLIKPIKEILSHA